MFSLTNREPFANMVSLHEAMNQLFEDSYVRNRAGNGRTFAPALEVSETEHGYTVELSVPGIKAEDLNVTFENNVLTVSGEVRREEESKERTYHHSERYYGKFQRSLTLPSTVKGDEINASLNDGILRLEIPKAEEVKPRRINVNVGEQKQISA
jgi:HSP20 family protein